MTYNEIEKAWRVSMRERDEAYMDWVAAPNDCATAYWERYCHAHVALVRVSDEYKQATWAWRARSAQKGDYVQG